MSQTPNSPEQSVRVMQIITVALVSGVVIFSLIAVFVVGALKERPNGQLISLLAVGMSVFAFVGHLVVPRILVRQAVQNVNPDDAGALCGIYQTQMIVGLALLEGMAFFNIIACIIEHNWWSLAVAGCLVLWMLMAFPSRDRVEQWIETQRMNADAGNSPQ